MKFTSVVILSCFLIGCQTPTSETQPIIQTFCNPVDLSYRFQLEGPSRREAADPTMVWFRDRYFLFASKSGGYWHSQDLLNWVFVETTDIPVEDYAPTVVEIRDTLFFMASSQESNPIYKTADPLSGKWVLAKDKLQQPVWDPALFLDDDGRLYLYWGCSNVNPLYGVELDPITFDFIGEPVVTMKADTANNGWEIPGDYNDIPNRAPWIEGSWMNKFNGKYYLQYSGPGTEFKSYSDATYVGDSPLGPFRLQDHNPFAYKPEGFAAAAGHGSTFSDVYGNLWHIGTITVSVKHMFERRLGLFPTFVDHHGTLYSNTAYGDYPMIMPARKLAEGESIFAGWMLLSYKKPVTVSSAIDILPASNMTDEDIRTFWSAASGSTGEYAVVDLGSECTVIAIQPNFAEHNTTVFGRKPGLAHRYIIESSNDNSAWEMLLDKSSNATDNTHDYFQLPKPIKARYLKITNIGVPDGNFAISGFRVFGKGVGSAPEKVLDLKAQRNSKDRKSVALSWNKSEGADGYVISYGVEPDHLYHSYMVYDTNTVTINSLNASLSYHFAIESFNENGRTEGGQIVISE